MIRSLAIFLIFLTIACQQRTTRFSRLSSAETGINFSNTITETDSMNVFSYEYIYNGGGVGIGDLNNDGLQDVFFSGSMVNNRLFLNKGGLAFEDISASLGGTPKNWSSGISLVDINGDGWLDIYVCTVYPDSARKRPNLFYINSGADEKGIPHFKERASEMGLADSAYSTQAAFFDYDHDGDMDMYLCTNSGKEGDRNALRRPQRNGKGLAQDKLFRNDGTDSLTHLPRFTDVSAAAGILTDGWGLGLIVKDINGDGWQDIYVANDFQSNDQLYINNQNGTFSDKISTYLKHQCHNAMGVDIADINNDALEDICVVDMLPDDNLRQKTMFGSVQNDRYNEALRMGYEPQFVRNMLQLNNGPVPGCDTPTVSFSDIGYLAGVEATDWSWSALFADFDLDGNKDLLITNGYVKDITDLDFVTFRNELSMFGSSSSKMERMRKKAAEMGSVKKPNFIFHNNGQLSFSNIAPEWGLTENSFTNGAAYADLDNDGDLDLVMNNLNDEAFVYRNNTRNEKGTKQANCLIISLRGEKDNLLGFGAKVSVWSKGRRQYSEHCTQRGYLSNMDSRLFFGLGQDAQVDSMEIIWVSGKRQVLLNPIINQPLVVREADAKLHYNLPNNTVVPLLTDITATLNLQEIGQVENDYLDFNYQFTVPHRYSQQGPALAVADLNGDGSEDIYIGGASRQSGQLLFQTSTGFTHRVLTDSAAKKLGEETGVLLFDADGDGDNDLYCVAGGNEFGDSASYQDLFFLNDGKGNFSPNPAALPNTTASGGSIAGADIDLDGDLDLFVTGRIKPNQYPLGAPCYFLRNDTDPRTRVVKFTDIRLEAIPDLPSTGLFTTALFSDYDQDGWPDLLVTGEFMPLQLYRNIRGRKFELVHVAAFRKTNGWYNSLACGDMDNDGDMDYIAGNLGLNTRYFASPSEPLSVRYSDFDLNGSVDAFLFGYHNGKEYPLQTRTVITEQIPSLKKRMLYYHDFGLMGYKDMFSEREREAAKTLEAYSMHSVYIENLGKGNFRVTPLPIMAQTAPIYGMVVSDFNADGYADILATGNSFAPEALNGRYDAGNGWLMVGNGHGEFNVLPMQQSGLLIPGDGKSLVALRRPDKNMVVLAAQNSGGLKAYGVNKVIHTIPLLPGDCHGIFTLINGQKRKFEAYYGSSYLSQSGRFLPIDSTVREIEIVGTGGRSRHMKVR